MLLTRRQLIKAAPLALAVAVMPRRFWQLDQTMIAKAAPEYQAIYKPMMHGEMHYSFTQGNYDSAWPSDHPAPSRMLITSNPPGRSWIKEYLDPPKNDILGLALDSADKDGYVRVATAAPDRQFIGEIVTPRYCAGESVQAGSLVALDWNGRVVMATPGDAFS